MWYGFFFRKVSGSQDNWMAGTEISHIALVPTHTSPLDQHPPQEWSPPYNWWTWWHMSFHSKSRAYWGFTLVAVLSMGLGKCKITYINHYSVIQSSFTFLKPFYLLPIHCPLSLSPGWYFYCPLSFTFFRIMWIKSHSCNTWERPYFPKKIVFWGSGE